MPRVRVSETRRQPTNPHRKLAGPLRALSKGVLFMLTLAAASNRERARVDFDGESQGLECRC